MTGILDAPYSEQSEQCVIGAVLIDPQSYYAIRANLAPSDFFLLKHNYIWQAISDIASENMPIDYLTIIQRLEAKKQLEQIGGAAYLTTMIGNTPSSQLATVYGELVRRASKRRQLMQLADKMKLLARDENKSLDEIAGEMSSKFFATIADTSSSEPSWYETVSAYTETMLDIWENPGKTLGIPTGIKAFDSHTLGLQKNELIYIAGRPGIGKTVVLLQWALHAASKGYKVAFWSGEMSRHQIAERAAASIARVANHKIRSTSMTDYERKCMTDAMRTLSTMPIVALWTDASITPAKLQLKILEQKAKTGIDIVFVDYVGLMNPDERTTSKYHEVTQISKALKGIANSCDIPVVSGLQLSRALETRQDKRPQLHDLRDSGALEQDADIVIGLYRDDYYNDASPTPNLMEVSMLKCRNGQTRNFTVGFNGSTSSIFEAQVRRVDMA